MFLTLCTCYSLLPVGKLLRCVLGLKCFGNISHRDNLLIDATYSVANAMILRHWMRSNHITDELESDIGLMERFFIRMITKRPHKVNLRCMQL